MKKGVSKALLADRMEYDDFSGAILEIGLRVGVFPPTLHFDMFFWSAISVYAHKQTITEAYLEEL